MSRSRSSATGPAPWPCSVTVTAACSGAGRSWSRSPRPRSGTRSARLAEAALALVGSARYAGLATVEFLVQDDTIAFAEVNPRLQVEHTVTEQVTGLDLVRARAARRRRRDPAGPGAGRASARRRDPGPGQHRDPAADGTFLPGTGTLSRFQPPAGRGVRVDTAGYPGYTVSPRYDPLLAKVITDGGTLEEAVRRAIRALAEFDVAGVPTNVVVRISHTVANA